MDEAETPRLLGEWPRAPPLEEKRPGWTSPLLEAAGRDRPVAAKKASKTKDKDRDATPTMGGTIDPASDDDGKAAAKRR